MTIFLGFIFLHLSLVQNTNYYIYTDSKDLTWISTTEGLQCFFGENVKIYDESNSDIIGKNIQSYIYEDDSTNLWFTTHEGLNKYHRLSDEISGKQFYWKDELLQTDYRLYGILNSVAWVGAEEYLFKYDLVNEKVIDSLQIDLSEFRLGYVFNNGKQDIIVTGENNDPKTYVYTFNDLFSNVKIDTFHLPFSRISKIDNSIILATNGKGVYNYNFENRDFERDFRFGQNSKFISTNGHYTVISEGQNILLCSTLNNCKKLNSNLPSTELYLDKNDIIWYSNDSKDIQYESLPKLKFDNIGTYNQQLISATSILEYNNQLWVASRYNGIYRYDTSFNIDENYSIENRNNTQNSFLDLFVWNGKLYAGSFKDIHVFDEASDKFVPFNFEIAFNLQSLNLKSNQILICDSESKSIYALTDSHNKNLNRVNDFIEEDEYRLTFGEDNNGFIYISVNKKYLQVLEFDTSTSKFNFQKRLNIPGIRDIYQLNKDSIFIGNSSGLYLYRPNSNIEIIKIEDSRKVLNTTIYSIQENKRSLWLGTAKGLIKYSIKDNSIHKFSIADGIQDIEYNSRASFKDDEGFLYFGGVNGVNRFHPDSITLLEVRPDIYISNILVNDEEYIFENYNLQTKLDFSFEENTLSFFFNSLDFSDPTHTRVKHLLENYDKNWVTSNTNVGQVRYPNLPPGKYTLKIKASNSDGIWSNKIKEIHITIHPPWYATWWARSLGVLLLGGLVYFTFRSYYKRQLKEKDLQLREANLTIAKQETLSKERTRIAAEMHDDLGGGLTTIRFLSQKALRNASDDQTQSLISKIANNAESLVNNMSEIIWAMNAKFDTLQSLISYCRRYANEYLTDNDIHLDFKVEGDTLNKKISGTERRNIFLAIKEGLHNIVKHSKAKEVNIQIVVKNTIYISLKDNGVGISENNEFGNGIENMKRRISSINGIISIQSSNSGTTIEINTLYDQED